MEIFKTIPGYPDYQISTLGNVKSLKFSKELMLKPRSHFRYSTVALFSNKKRATFSIHQLMAITFLNHIPDRGLVVDHINNISLDNRLKNLQIITARENLSKDKKGYSSKYIGVHWDKISNKWRAEIRVKNKKKFLGRFTSELEASNAYQSALLTHHAPTQTQHNSSK